MADDFPERASTDDEFEVTSLTEGPFGEREIDVTPRRYLGTTLLRRLMESRTARAVGGVVAAGGIAWWLIEQALGSDEAAANPDSGIPENIIRWQRENATLLASTIPDIDTGIQPILNEYQYLTTGQGDESIIGFQLPAGGRARLRRVMLSVVANRRPGVTQEDLYSNLLNTAAQTIQQLQPDITTGISYSTGLFLYALSFVPRRSQLLGQPELPVPRLNIGEYPIQIINTWSVERAANLGVWGLIGKIATTMTQFGARTSDGEYPGFEPRAAGDLIDAIYAFGEDRLIGALGTTEGQAIYNRVRTGRPSLLRDVNLTDPTDTTAFVRELMLINRHYNDMLVDEAFRPKNYQDILAEARRLEQTTPLAVEGRLDLALMDAGRYIEDICQSYVLNSGLPLIDLICGDLENAWQMLSLIIGR